MQPIVIDIAASGVVKGMHRDEFNLGFLGAQRIERASEILFMEDTQTWIIAAPGVHKRKLWGATDYSPGAAEGMPEVMLLANHPFDSYNTARDFEVEWMNACRIKSTAPFTFASLTIADAVALLRSPATS